MTIKDQNAEKDKYMSAHDDMLDEFDEPTEPLSLRRQGAAHMQGNPPGLPTTQTVQRSQISRRELFGVTAIGLAGLGAAAGGVALEQWWQHGGLKHLFHSPVVGNMQIGHLLR